MLVQPTSEFITWLAPPPRPSRRQVKKIAAAASIRVTKTKTNWLDIDHASGRLLTGIGIVAAAADIPRTGRLWRRRRWTCRACALPPSDSRHHHLHKQQQHLSIDLPKSVTTKLSAHRFYVSGQLSHELDSHSGGGATTATQELAASTHEFINFREDPLLDELRTQLGVIHPIPSPPLNRSVVGLFVFFFFVGVAFGKIWTSRRRKKSFRDAESGIWPQLPTGFSLFLERDLQRKESVEWVNMVLGKLWKVYRAGIENWIVGLLQPVIDNLKKPDYVQRVEIKQFSLGEEPLSVRNVERRTSRHANDLQYQIGLRYTGGARMLLMLSLKFGMLPIVVPVGVRDFDIDGELWVKLRLITSEPWVGSVSCAFVSLPKIKFVLSPFRLFNLMAIPVLSMFLTKLLTEDLPRLFVRPKRIFLDFQKGKAVGPSPEDFQTEAAQEGNNDFVGELSVTLVDARKLSYVFDGKADPYVILSLGNQIIRSKKNSQTTVIGPPGEPIWNQDFHMLVADPKSQKLGIQVIDSLGFAEFTVGTAEVELESLEDTVPTDKIISLRRGWIMFGKGSAGQILLRLTYKAYVEDEEDDKTTIGSVDGDLSDDEDSGADESEETLVHGQTEIPVEMEKESLMDVLAALIVSEEFQCIVASENGTSKPSTDSAKSAPIVSTLDGPTVDSVPSDPAERSDILGALLWLAVITCIAVIIHLNVGGSSFFNP